MTNHSQAYSDGYTQGKADSEEGRPRLYLVGPLSALNIYQQGYAWGYRFSQANLAVPAGDTPDP